MILDKKNFLYNINNSTCKNNNSIRLKSRIKFKIKVTILQ